MSNLEENEIDNKYTREVVCPHCGYEHGDSWELSDEGEMDCSECDKSFKFNRDIEVTYSTEKIKESK